MWDGVSVVGSEIGALTIIVVEQNDGGYAKSGPKLAVTVVWLKTDIVGKKVSTGSPVNAMP